MLQQIHYWLNPRINRHILDGKRWVHNTYEQWQEQFPFWSVRTIQRVLCALEEQGLLLTFIEHDFQKTKYYTLDYERLHEMQLGSFLPPSFATRQNDVIEQPNLATPSRHSDAIDHDKMACTYKLNTENTFTENPPPLTPPPHLLPRQDEEEEEMIQQKRELDSPQAHTATQMIEVWNRCVQSHFSNSKVSLTFERAQKLESFLKQTSVRDGGAWELYCSKIANSRFLMGVNATGFKVTLDWALNSQNALKVLEDAFYDKPSSPVASQAPIERPWSQYVGILKQHCEMNGYSERWLEVCKALVCAVGQTTFENWFKEIKPVEQDDKTLHLLVKSHFLRDYLLLTHEAVLRKAIHTGFPSSTSFEIRVGQLDCSRPPFADP